MATTTEKVNMYEMGTTIVTTTSTEKTMEKGTIGLSYMSLLKIENLQLGKVEVLCHISRYVAENVEEI